MHFRYAGPSGPWRATALLCLVGVILPNLLLFGAHFAGALVPWRPETIALYALVAVFARFAPRFVIAILFLFVAITDIIVAIALIYNLTVFEVVLSVPQIFKLDLMASQPMIALSILGVGATATTLWLMLRYRAILAAGRLSVFAGVVAVATIFASLNAFEPHYHFGLSFADGKPMESAVHSSGFVRDNLTNLERPVLIVIVESLGQFADPKHRALIDEAFKTQDVADRYIVSSGTTAYYGSTTAAEMRELCFSRASYSEVAKREKNGCVPQQFAERGRHTVAIHGFSEKFFGRRSWYPAIGFQRALFAEDVQDRSLKHCGAHFLGPCDTAMVPIVAEMIREVREPLFLYWLTLSTHVPVLNREGQARLDCDEGGGPIGNVRVCYMTELWIDVIEGVKRLANEFAPMEVLIVGDHAPPLWSRAERSLFVAGKVPWFRLSPRDNIVADQTMRKADQSNDAVKVP